MKATITRIDAEKEEATVVIGCIISITSNSRRKLPKIIK